MNAKNWIGIIVVGLAVSCGDADGTEPEGNSSNVTTNNSTNNASENGATTGTNATTNSATNLATNASTPNNSSPNGATNNSSPNGTPNANTGECDWEAVDRVITIEAEDLPLNEDWTVGTDVADYQGTGYAYWSGESHNNDPTHGVMSIKVRITEPGRYQLHWRAQIGMGTNTTEHNDMWIRFPDAEDYYGLKGESGAEIRRYYKPKCEDQAAMDAIMALPDVETADCARGSTRDGWMKVYGAGQEWRWAGKTSDSDASDVTAEFPSPGIYTIEFAARADFFLLDTIVFRHESLRNGDVRGLPQTQCE